MEDNYDWKWKQIVAKVEGIDPNDEKLMNLIANRVRHAEEALVKAFNEDLFSGGPDLPPIEYTRWERFKFKVQKLLAPYYWLKWRLIMTYRVWTQGECGECARDDW